MKDVLDLYQQSYDPNYPVICMDEKPYQLLGETRHAIPMKRGRPKRLDAMTKQCLNGIIYYITSIETELAAWEAASNTM